MAAPIELELLLDKLTGEAANVVDLFRRWDDNLNGMVSKDEFRRAMPVLGLGFPKEVIEELFTFMDDDGSGQVGLCLPKPQPQPQT